MVSRPFGKIDFHLHSYASNVTDYYAANSFAIPESYSDPLVLHAELRRQGMTLITLTDHNSIDGVKAMLDAGLPDVFISAEMTASFPEDGCNIHVTVANMTEAQFAEVDRLRSNVYEMIAYVDEQIAGEQQAPAGNRLAYFMTHPLMSTQNRPYGREGALTLAHIEKCLLLCNMFEVRNGTRTKSLNDLTHGLISTLDQATIERLAGRHGLAPKGPQPWRKTILAGSDDHSGINPGRTWTEFLLQPGPAGQLVQPTANDLIDAMRRGQTVPAGAHGGPVTLAHAMLKLIHDGQARRPAGDAKRSVSLGGPIQALLKMVFDPAGMTLRDKLSFRGRACWRALSQRLPVASRTRRRPFESMVSNEAEQLLTEPEFSSRLAATARTDDKIFLVVSSLLNRIFARYAARIARANSADLVCVVKEVVALVASNVFVSMPYLLSYLHQSSDKALVADVRRSFRLHEPQRMVLVTDTLFEVNGVARTIRRMAEEARRRGIDLTIVTCLGAEEAARQSARPDVRELLESGRLKILPSIVDFAMPHYDGLRVHFPPFLELLKFLQEGGFARMQISTPGTIGVAGLLAAKILQIETSATYHTSFPEYIEAYTKDISLEALAWKYMVLFYHAVDEVVVPSRFIASLLHDRGLRKRKLLVLDRWVDLQKFRPEKRVPGFWQARGLVDADHLVKFVYVGRVSAEKGLNVLVDAYRALRAEMPHAHLVVVGDGPWRAEMERQLGALPATFTGFLEGELLSQALASCDVKVFPSTTDTWGNAPLEAQASGLPVIVTDVGGPQELMRPGVTGLTVRGRSVDDLLSAMRVLMDPDVRAAMGSEARAFAERNRVDEPFSAILDPDAYRRRVRAIKHGTNEPEAPVVEARAELISAWHDVEAPMPPRVANSVDEAVNA
jgi:glycosyltransferase involved in cell wall biosynthesis